MTTVNPIQTIGGMNLNTPYHSSNEEKQQNLRPDQIVRAVVQEGGREEVLLDLGAQKLRAQANFDLQTGQTVDLKVLRTEPRLELQVLSDFFGNRLSHYLHFLEGSWSLLPPLRKLLQMNQGLPEEVNALFTQWLTLQNQLGEVADGELLRQLWQFIGFDLERRLSKGETGLDCNLKSAMLSLMEQAADADAEVNQKSERILKTIEFFQLCQVRLNDQNVAFFPLPLPFLEQGFFLYEQKGERGENLDEQNENLISLFLSLQNLGSLRIDLLHDQEGLLLRFLAENDEKARFLARWEESLRTVLSSFAIKGVSFQSGAQSPAKELIQRLFPKGNNVFDARV